MEYEITLTGATYTVEPYVDDGEAFAVIRSVSGLEQWGSDDLPFLFDDDVHRRLTRELREMMRAEGDEV